MLEWAGHLHLLTQTPISRGSPLTSHQQQQTVKRLKIHPSIFYSFFLTLGAALCWSLSQLSGAEARAAPWIGRQPMRRLNTSGPVRRLACTLSRVSSVLGRRDVCQTSGSRWHVDRNRTKLTPRAAAASAAGRRARDLPWWSALPELPGRDVTSATHLSLEKTSK